LLVEHLWPFAASERVAFITWLYNFDTSDFDDWLLAGDFNLLGLQLTETKRVVISRICFSLMIYPAL
jgi:hypothetical protein